MLIVLTGKMYNLAGERVIRAEMQRLISRLGHQMWQTMAPDVDLLVIGETPGARVTTKQRIAERTGVPIISGRQFFEWLRREDESLETYVAQYGGVTEERENNLRYPGQRYQINGQDVTEQEFHDARARAAGRAFDRVQIQADQEEQSATADGIVRNPRTTQEALADPRREEVMSDVREQMKDNPVHKPYDRARKIRVRKHTKADYT